jgi:hypothetical protein
MRCETDLAALKRATGASREETINRCVQGAIEKVAGNELQIQPEGIKGQTQSLDSEFGCVFHQNPEYGWVEMEVQVAVDMVEWQAGLTEFVKLGVDFVAQLVAQAGIEEIPKARARWTVGKLVAAVHQSGDLVCRQR